MECSQGHPGGTWGQTHECSRRFWPEPTSEKGSCCGSAGERNLAELLLQRLLDSFAGPVLLWPLVAPRSAEAADAAARLSGDPLPARLPGAGAEHEGGCRVRGDMAMRALGPQRCGCPGSAFCSSCQAL